MRMILIYKAFTCRLTKKQQQQTQNITCSVYFNACMLIKCTLGHYQKQKITGESG